MKKLIILLSMLVAYSIAGTMTDSRDGQKYKTVKIGNQTWMAENLNYKTSNSYCYDNDEGMCKKYGRLYKWNAAKSACPSGWHLPSDDEWNTLWTAVGGTSTAGTKLKSKSGWYNNGSDSFGFAVLPAGFRSSYKGEFNSEGYGASFWSSSEYSSYGAHSWYFNYDNDDVRRDGDDKPNGFSVRCLRDSNEEREASLARPSEAGATTEQNQGRIKDPRDGKTYRTVKIGKQTWMAENLNYKTSDSYCYNNNEGMCKKYGRLYTWYAAKKACPSGWHLPSDDEWNTLWTAVGGTGTAGTKLKSKSGWDNNGNGTDSFGFAVLPAVYRDYRGDFTLEGVYAYFWSSTENGSNDAYHWFFISFIDDVLRHYGTKDGGLSVRCLQDSNEEREASLARPSEAGAATEQNQGRIKDPRDGKTYRTVKIGKQTWMAENLNYKTSDSYCYNNDEGMCKKYGRLYTWYAAKKACPSGWHLPSDDEWNTLWTAVGGTGTAGTKLKSKSMNGSDSFGFAVLPAGYRIHDGNFNYEGDYANFWSSSEYFSNNAYGWSFDYGGDDVSSYSDNKNSGFSVRCLRN